MLNEILLNSEKAQKQSELIDEVNGNLETLSQYVVHQAESISAITKERHSIISSITKLSNNNEIGFVLQIIRNALYEWFNEKNSRN